MNIIYVYIFTCIFNLHIHTRVHNARLINNYNDKNTRKIVILFVVILRVICLEVLFAEECILNIFYLFKIQQTRTATTRTATTHTEIFSKSY